jgi:hypothetical protein
MTILHCFSTAILVSGRADFSLWPWVVRVGYYSSLLSVLLSAWTLLKRAGTPTIFASISMMLRSWRSFAMVASSRISRRTRGVARYAPILLMGAVCLGFSYGIYRIPQYPVVELHNVRVEKQVADNKWLMEDAASGRFLFTACHDFPTKGVIEAGYVARKIRYEEHGACKSILKPDLGVWWERDADGNAVTIQALDGHD